MRHSGSTGRRRAADGEAMQSVAVVVVVAVKSLGCLQLICVFVSPPPPVWLQNGSSFVTT